MTKSLKDQTPAEIDGQLAEILGQQYRIQDKIAYALKTITRYGNETFAVYKQYAVDAEAELVTLKAQFVALTEQAAPFNDEFTRRGGWTRAYIVQNSNGHVHNTTHCSTCYPTTQFGWVTKVSGHDEDEIVDAAGESACTVCYPSAPVRPSFKQANRLETADMETARIVREAAAAERAVKAAQKATKAISNPDGTPLKTTEWRDTLKTEQAAWNHLVNAIGSSKAYGYSLNTNDVDAITEALNFKLGDPELVQETLAKKLAAWMKRNGR